MGDRVSFSVAAADALPAAGYDLVTCFDCLHDTGDPAAVARHVRSALAPGGTWMIVGPRAGDSVPERPLREELLDPRPLCLAPDEHPCSTRPGVAADVKARSSPRRSYLP